jgi:predicted NBD/HSP70 family sugar kinase
MTRAAADLDYLRDYNEALVVAIGRTMPTFDRASIAGATGLTPQAVSKVLGRLAEHGLVASAGSRRQGVGKPAAVYRIVPTSRYAIGAHVARRTLRLVLTDLVGTVVTSAVTPLPADFTPETLLAELAAGVEATTRAHPEAAGLVTGVGIGMFGPLDHAHGVVRDAHRLRHWHDVPLRDLAAAALGLPVHLDKDVTAGVTAEAWRRGTALRHGALIMVESGIGAGLWLGGAAYRGAHTNAGEFGHTVVLLDGPRCVCGRHGCLEVVHDRAAEAGDVERAARVLAAGIVNLLQTVDVDHVVLAGADLIRHADVYRGAVEHAVRTDVPRADWLTVDVTLSSLAADVVAAGAAMQVLNARYGLPVPDPADHA